MEFCLLSAPVRYINLVRIQMACDLLQMSNDSIAHIAYKTGFETLTTFNRNFKKILGISPREWRNHPENYERKLLEYNIQTEDGW